MASKYTKGERRVMWTIAACLWAMVGAMVWFTVHLWEDDPCRLASSEPTDLTCVTVDPPPSELYGVNV